MQFQGREYSQTVSPANGPMNLDAGKPTPQEAMQSGLVSIAFLGVSSVGLLVVYGFAPSDPVFSYGGRFQVPLWRLLGMLIGTLFSCFSWRFAYAYARMSLTLWDSYVMRLDKWDTLQRRLFAEQGGLNIQTKVSIYTISVQSPKDVAISAMLIHRELANQNRAILTVRGIEDRNGKLYMRRSNGSQLLMGEIGGTMPEKLLNRFATLGLIEGRKERHSGVWVPRTELEAFNMVVDRWRDTSAPIDSEYVND